MSLPVQIMVMPAPEARLPVSGVPEEVPSSESLAPTASSLRTPPPRPGLKRRIFLGGVLSCSLSSEVEKNVLVFWNVQTAPSRSLVTMTSDRLSGSPSRFFRQTSRGFEVVGKFGSESNGLPTDSVNETAPGVLVLSRTVNVPSV